MGSKNLKAIAVRGTQKPAIADPAKFQERRKTLLKAMKDSPMLYPTFSKTGTPVVVDVLTGMGIFPSRTGRLRARSIWCRLWA